MLKKYKNLLRLYITGFIMGTADLVPGVSGGTVAFVSGIYEELLEAIKRVSGNTLRLLLKKQFVAAWKSVPFKFLLPLVAGIFTAIFSLAQLFTFLLNNHSRMVWAFFFGLVAASTYTVAQRIVKWDSRDILSFLASGLFAYWLVGDHLVSTPHTLPMLFVSGAIAICAMILPGISGSFILVLLGQYSFLLSSVVEKRFTVLIIFSLGAALGLSLFSRFLTWLFLKHHDISVAILAGFMLGSLRKIWPFTNNESTDFLNPTVWILVVAGGAVVLMLTKHDNLKERTQDLPKNQNFEKEHATALKKINN